MVRTMRNDTKRIPRKSSRARPLSISKANNQFGKDLDNMLERAFMLGIKWAGLPVFNREQAEKNALRWWKKFNAR